MRWTCSICNLHFAVHNLQFSLFLSPTACTPLLSLLLSAGVGYNKNSNLRPPGAFNE